MDDMFDYDKLAEKGRMSYRKKVAKKEGQFAERKELFVFGAAKKQAYEEKKIDLQEKKAKRLGEQKALRKERLYSQAKAIGIGAVTRAVRLIDIKTPKVSGAARRGLFNRSRFGR